MLIITAGSGDTYDYSKTINYNVKKCKEFGYASKVFDIGNLGFGEKVEDPRTSSQNRIVRTALKPELIQRSLLNCSHEEVIWIDGDATLIHPIDEIVEDLSWDVGFTVRAKRVSRKSNYINAGVCFFRQPAWRFVAKWIESFPPVPKLDHRPGEKHPSYCDQVILENEVLLPVIKDPLWDLVGQVREVEGARVKFFPCEIYNNFDCVKSPAYNKGPGKAKIIHFKGHRMHRIDDYHERFLS